MAAAVAATVLNVQNVQTNICAYTQKCTKTKSDGNFILRAALYLHIDFIWANKWTQDGEKAQPAHTRWTKKKQKNIWNQNEKKIHE